METSDSRLVRVAIVVLAQVAVIVVMYGLGIHQRLPFASSEANTIFMPALLALAANIYVIWSSHVCLGKPTWVRAVVAIGIALAAAVVGCSVALWIALNRWGS